MAETDLPINPIFVGGYPRSGTTLLRYMLDSHPNIICGPETEFFVVDIRKCIEGIFASGRYEEYLKAHKLAAADIYELVGRSVIEAFARRQLQAHGKKRWADKSPTNCCHFDFLANCFPQACFIHVIRDGRDCICSLQDVKSHADVFEDNRSFSQAAQEWVRWVSKGRQDGAKLARYLEVSYEELVGEPRQTMQRILNFVGEPWDEAVLHHDRREYIFEASLDDKNRQGAAQPVHTKSVGQWRTRMTPSQVHLFESVGGALLHALNYPVENKTGQCPLTPVQMGWFRRALRVLGESPWIP